MNLIRTLNRCGSGPICSLVLVFQGKPGKDGEPGELGEQVTRSAACCRLKETQSVDRETKLCESTSRTRTRTIRTLVCIFMLFSLRLEKEAPLCDSSVAPGLDSEQVLTRGSGQQNELTQVLSAGRPRGSWVPRSSWYRRNSGELYMNTGSVTAVVHSVVCECSCRVFAGRER